MKNLNKKIVRDIKQNKMQFFNIFIMVFLGVFVFAGIHSYMDGMQISGDKYFESNNLQDIWISGENFSSDDLEKVKDVKNVKNAERILSIRTNLENYDDVELEANFIETNEISKMYVVSGERYSKDKEGIWLDSYLAKNLNINLGDELTLDYKDYKIKEKVVGLINVPDHVYSVKDETAIFPTHKDFGYAYLSINEFPQDYIYDELRNKIIEENPMMKAIGKDKITNKDIRRLIKNFDISDYYVFNQIIVDVDDTSKLDETKRDLENEIDSAIAITDRTSNSSCEAFKSEIEEGGTYSSVFTFLFLFIAILSVVTTMNRFVKKQRTQIGTLKALGFKNRKIIRHYVGYGFYTSLVASAVGLLVGKFVLGGFFLNMEMSYFEVPVYNTVLVSQVYMLAIAVIVLITFVTYLSCRSILKESAVDALRVEVPKVKNTKFDLTTKGIFKKSSISTRWNLRDIGRNKSRSIMAIVGMAGCTMLLLCAFGMLNTMNAYLDWEFDEITNFEYKLSLSSKITDDELDNLKDKYGDATSETLGIEVKNGVNKETNTLTVNDAVGKLRYTNHNKEIINLKEDGIYITEKLSEKYGLNIGDEISWHIFGDDEWHTSKIVGLNRDPQSQSLNMSRKYYKSLDLEYKPDSLYTDYDLSKQNSLTGVDSIQSIENLRTGMESMLETVKTMVVILIIVSAILGFVIIYNLGILSFTEKQYQFATLKVLGFKNKQIKKIFVKQNIWLSLVGIILGLPLGFLMLDYIFKAALGDSYDFPAVVNSESYLIAGIGSLIVAIVVNKFLSRKVKTIDMVTSLKGNE